MECWASWGACGGPGSGLIPCGATNGAIVWAIGMVIGQTGDAFRQSLANGHLGEDACVFIEYEERSL